MLELERERVAGAARRLSEEGLVIGTAGNVSERCDQLVAVTPTGASLGELDGEQVAVVDLDGVQQDGELEPTSELSLHLEIYRRYQSGAVVHTHAPMATALSCVIDELPLVHYGMLALGGAVRVAPYATFGSRELAGGTVEALRDRAAALMANHGAIVHSGDLGAAVENSILLEWACTVYWRAAAIGNPRALDDDQREAVLDAVLQRGYGSTHKIAK